INNRLNIKQRMMLIVLSISIATLLILSAVSFYGIIGSKNMAIETSDDIGKQSSENSSKILEEQMKSELTKLSLDKANDINHRMNDLAREVESVAHEMNEINRNPSNFLPHNVNEPDQINAGEIGFYIQHSENFNRNIFSDEIAMTANIQDFLTEAIERNSMISSIFVSSKNNFTLSADDNRQKTADTFKPSPLIYDAVVRDWYKSAISEQKLIFTNVREFIFSKKLGLFCAVPYYEINGEIAGVACAQASLERINQIVKEVELYNTGFCFVLDNRGYVILNSEDGSPPELSVNLNNDIRSSGNNVLSSIAEAMTTGKNGLEEIQLNDKDYYIAYAPIERMGWSFGAAIAKEEVIAPVVKNAEVIENITQENISKLNSHMFQTMIFMVIFVLLLLMSVTYIGRRLSNHFVEPIHELSDGVREIASGDLDKKLNIKTGDEIEHLAICFNAMTDELKTYMDNLTKITAEKERIATELDVAKNIQTSMLPNIFPPFPDKKEFSIYATMNAAKEVGGDFYDFYLLDTHHLVVTIADVSGKGIPAALFMMISKTILKNFSMTMTNPDDFAAVMSLSNNQLCQNNDAMMFVTVFMGMLDIKTGEFVFVNGGHNPPLVYHKATDSYEYIKVKKNFVLGGMEDINFKQQSIKLDKGDIIFMYTDGVTEALNPNNELYGEERLINCLNRSDKNLPVEELLAFVRADVNTHVNGADQSDDITMLALKFN
ncbi:MAG: SpoIIE family protein phosphatase, partial [Selenomonadaceae bacterium]|nr:SpoIIE family protein phosphatase [Selenomonadaceae bacterium]